MFRSASLCSATIILLSFLFGCNAETTENVNLKSDSKYQTENIQINKTNEQANLPTPQEKRTETANDNFAGTAGIVKNDHKIKKTAILKDVRAAQHENYDRFVFEFQTSEIPGYRIEYVDKPVRLCGSGEAISLAGDGWLEISLTPAQAHDDNGRATIENREQKFDFPILKEAKSTCDFEAEVVYVLGVASPNKYRVLELSNPARLAIDIKH